MKKYTLYLLLIFLPLLGMAQSSDFGTEVGVDYNLKLGSGFSLNFEGEARFTDISTKFNKGELSAGIQYSILRDQLKPIGMKLRVGANYAMRYKLNSLDLYEFQNRVNAYLSVSKKLGQFQIALRERYQCDWRDMDKGDYTYNPKMHLRTRLKFSYEPEYIPWEFYISEEAYYRVNHPKNNEFDELRTTLGVTRIINSTNAITLYIKAANEINKKRADNFYALGLAYSFR